jgi:hypothetical protein
MDLNNSLNIWVEHINGLVFLRNSKYQGHAINGFKDGKSTKAAHDFIQQFMISNGSANFSMDVSNVASTLFKIYEKAEASEYSATTYAFLGKIMTTKNILNYSLTENQLEILQEKYNTAKTIFDTLVVDDPFETNQNVVNETLIVPQTQSQSNNQSELSQLITNLLKEKFDELKSEMNVKLEDLRNNNENYENKTLSQLTKLLNFRIRKRLLAKHSINIQNEHLKNGTAPAQLQADKFFIPYCFTSRFLTKMDEILKTVQKAIMEAIIEEINFKIELIEQDIEKIKKAIEKHKNKSEIPKFTEDLEENESKKLKKRFARSLNKTKKASISFLDLYENKITGDDDVLSETSQTSNVSIVSNKSTSERANKNNANFRHSRKSFNTNKRNDDDEKSVKPKSILRNTNSRSNSTRRESSINRTSNQRENNQQYNRQNNQQKRNNNNHQNRYNNENRENREVNYNEGRKNNSNVNFHSRNQRKMSR